MEFGALQCVPKNPKCEICSLKLNCYAYTNKCIEQLPVKIKKAAQRDRFFNYLYINEKNYTYI